MDTPDPFAFIRSAGQGWEALLLVSAPLLVLLVIAAVYAVLSVLKQRHEDRILRPAMDLDEEPKAQPPSKTESLVHTTDLETSPAAEVKSDVSPKVVTTPTIPTEVDEIRKSDRASWLSRLQGGLAKTRNSLQQNLRGLIGASAKIDDDLLEKLHEVLYRADVGVKTADKLVTGIRDRLSSDQGADWEGVTQCLKDQALTLLDRPQTPVAPPANGPWVILVIGVNGVGKTTTIGKLAANFLAQEKTVLLCAADTFRAAAIDQLQVWGDRLGIDVIKHQQGSDPAAVAYDAVKAANSRNSDVLLIDTAGRLHNKTDLMQELGKINRVIGKDLPGAPHETWLVIDATTGQNAVVQVKAFREVVDVTGLVVTKLDGTAKGGVVIGISDQFELPVRYVGVGEKAADLRGFTPRDYVEFVF